MASSFLDNLKNAVDKGEFNSEAAKKILEINKLADEKIKTMVKPNEFVTGSEISESLNKRLEDAGVKTVSEEEAVALNSEYEKKMEEIRLADIENKRLADLANIVDAQLKTLVEIEDMVKASIADMFSFTDELEGKFKKEFEEGNQMFAELYAKIVEIKIKYESNINK